MYNLALEDRELDLEASLTGSVYNHREIRQELQDQGYRFSTENESEVILKAYHHWGENFVERLNGAFAFSLYDRKTGDLHLGRDPLGLKQLYYSENGQICFGPDIRSLKKQGLTDFSLDREALHYFLTFHAVVPAPRTIFAAVQKVEPGTVLTLEKDGKKRVNRYWSLNMNDKQDLNQEEWIELILETMRRSIKLRMNEDEPVGALLSGGVDSSLIVALMAEENRGRRLPTYSIGFAGAGGEEGDEFRYSDLIADKFGTDHQKIYADGGNLLSRVQDSLRAMTEPMISYDAVGFYLLAREVSKKTKVVLCGQGADEIFAGYHWYPRIMENNGELTPDQLYRRNFFDRSHREVQTILGEDYKPEEDYSGNFMRSRFNWPESGEIGVDKALHLDTTVMLVEDPAKRVDNMTAAWGLDARVPFLDREMVELAASIPAGLKVRDGGKYILKKAAERVLPHQVIYRPKGYFPVPALKYMRDEFLQFAREILYSDRAGQRGLFNSAELDQMFLNPAEQLTVLRGNKIWQLAVLEFWLQEFEKER